MAGDNLDNMFENDDNQQMDDQGSMGGDDQGSSQTPGDQGDGQQSSASDQGQDKFAQLENQLRETQAALAYMKGRLEAGATPPKNEKEGETPEPVNYWTPEELQQMNDGDMSPLGAGMARAMQSFQTSLMQSLPGMVSQMLDTKITTQATTEQFFAKHKALNTDIGRVVLRHIASSLTKQNPSWELPKILEEASKQAYKDLNIQPGGGQQQQPAAGSQGGAGGRSGGAPARQPKVDPQKASIQGQIDDFFKN